MVPASPYLTKSGEARLMASPSACFGRLICMVFVFLISNIVMLLWLVFDCAACVLCVAAIGFFSCFAVFWLCFAGFV